MAAIRPTAERRLAYLVKAQEARAVALDLRDAQARELWGQIAEEWQHLAEQVLRMDKM